MKKQSIKDFVSLVPEAKIAALREAAKPKGKPALWIAKYLDDNQLAEIYFRMFEAQEPVSFIAKIARELWSVPMEVKQLTKGLHVWKERVQTAIDEYVEVAEDKDKALRRKQRERELSAKLDPVGRLGWAIELQTARLLLAREKEKMANIPMKITDQILSGLTNMIEAYVGLALKTGAIDGVPSEINVNLQQKSELVLTKYVSEDKHKMVRAARDFLNVLESRCVLLEMDPETGNYAPVEESDAQIPERIKLT